jgi:hypothetical protein
MIGELEKHVCDFAHCRWCVACFTGVEERETPPLPTKTYTHPPLTPPPPPQTLLRIDLHPDLLHRGWPHVLAYLKQPRFMGLVAAAAGGSCCRGVDAPSQERQHALGSGTAAAVQKTRHHCDDCMMWYRLQVATALGRSAF